MSKKSAKIAALIEQCHGQAWPAHYLGYFTCFNQQLFYEAHDVLEELWLPARHQPDGLFYQGLIQLAGAFVHLQKSRLGPAAALFEKGGNNLAKYPDVHMGLRVNDVLKAIAFWRRELEQGHVNPLTIHAAPKLNPDSNL